MKANVHTASGRSTPNETEVVTKEHSPSKSKQATASGSSSSLSPPSHLQSPTVATHIQGADSARASPAPSSSSGDSHQPPPAASIPQHMTFGSDPSTFDDPTIYHIREVTANMTDDEKKEIYGVSSFPKDDLADLIAGMPPDKDFSNAKPSNQVNANTFATYLEPYLRPLVEEDLGWLKERVCQTHHPKRVLADCVRVIELHHLSFHVAERSITRKSGPKRTGRFQSTQPITEGISYQPINPVAVWSR